MNTKQQLREAIRAFALAITPVDRLAAYLWLHAVVAGLHRTARVA
jgi:hypothetical protein